MNIKNLIKTLLIICFTPFLLSCSNEKLAKIDYSGGGNISLVINDKNVKAPLEIQAGKAGEGAVYYETEKGKYFITDKPSKLKVMKMNSMLNGNQVAEQF
jgi:hypothetical protein